MKNKKIKVSIIIPTLNRTDMLINTIKDLLDLKYSNYEIIIVDQSDKIDKKIFDFVKKHYKIIKYFHITKKSSPNAKNVGVKNCSGEIIIFIDDDVEIKEKKFIQYHLENYKNNLIGGVSGRVIIENEKKTKNKEVGKFKYFGLKQIANYDSDFRVYVDSVYGCNASFSREAFNKAGGFSDIFVGNAYLEESDFSFKVKRAGYKLIFDPKPVLKHLIYKKGGYRIKDIYKFRYSMIINKTIFYLRNYNHILFSLFFLKEFFWAVGSAIKRKDYKIYKYMTDAIIDGYRYYKNNYNKKFVKI